MERTIRSPREEIPGRKKSKRNNPLGSSKDRRQSRVPSVRKPDRRGEGRLQRGWFHEPESEFPDRIKECYLEPSLKDAKAYDSFQFVRNGFFCVDAKDSKEDALVFNRIVSLKSSFKLPAAK